MNRRPNGLERAMGKSNKPERRPNEEGPHAAAAPRQHRPVPEAHHSASALVEVADAVDAGGKKDPSKPGRGPNAVVAHKKVTFRPQAFSASIHRTCVYWPAGITCASATVGAVSSRRMIGFLLADQTRLEAA